MRNIGAHLSIAGGIHRAVNKARELGINALQIFLKNSNRWSAKPFSDNDIRSYHEAIAQVPGIAVFAHSGYLINLAGDGDTYKKSLHALRDELIRAEQLGIRYLVIHPGSHGGKGMESGIRRIADSLNTVIKDTDSVTILLETTAGQGTSVGYRFEHLRAIIDLSEKPENLAVCLDTCHVFAAGYPINTSRGCAALVDEFDSIIGLDNLVLIHLNDSIRECGSRVDRHMHLGEGKIGRNGLVALLNENRLADVPVIIETPKTKNDEADRMNLQRIYDYMKDSQNPRDSDIDTSRSTTM